jgi:hypothetical protein
MVACCSAEAVRCGLCPDGVLVAVSARPGKLLGGRGPVAPRHAHRHARACQGVVVGV